MLEARSRVGGRIWTLAEPPLGLALELGAEFVHGRPAATLERIERAGGAIVDSARAHWILRAGLLRTSDEDFDELKRGLKRIRRPRRDLPFAQFLQTRAVETLSERARALAILLVEGFDAADSSRASTHATLEEWSGQGGADAPTFRPAGGYGALVESLRLELEAKNASLRLDSQASDVRWERGRVVIAGAAAGASFELAADRAVIALPLGVLELSPHAAQAVRFTPALHGKAQSFAGLAAGPVIKILLRFREPFWERVDGGRYENAAFFHAPECAFPTFWTMLPVRCSWLVGWCAGPHAARLTGAQELRIVRAALTSLRRIFGGRRLPPLDEVRLHDWQADPHARGAYSYVTVGGAATARARLAAPVEETLFFAGEAADTEGESGTVAGALQSGRRAARELLATL